MSESIEERAKRERQRVLFDDVADLYDATRRGYPDEIVRFAISTADLGRGDRVLEVGCGTGQLTRRLASEGFDLVAIDIGPAMVARARGHVGESARFEVVAFEDFAAPDDSIALVVSATAFHWVDPDVGFAKAARLLRPGGWLAVMGTRELYDDPLGAGLHDLWIACSSDTGAWATTKEPTVAERVAASGLFAPAVEHTHQARLTLTPAAVFDLEHTRATSLSYDSATRARFDHGLAALLEPLDEVMLTQRTTLTMAHV